MPFALPSRLFARRTLTVCAGLIATIASLFAQTPSAADGFDPDVDGNVFVLITQPDGKLLVGGQFSSIRGFGRNNVARLNLDGTVDETFDPNANGPVRALAVQADNRIVIGGDFTALQPSGTTAPTTRNLLARLNADGSVDGSFNPGVGGDLQPQVHAVAVQANGQILAGGSFNTVQGTTRNYLARFNANGALDQAYNPNPNSIVLALLPHVDGKMLVAGGFTAFAPNGATESTTRNRIARLNSNGTLDADFDPNANNGVTSLALQRDGKILLGGYFTSLQPAGTEGPASRVHLARLEVSGALDVNFYPRVEGDVLAVAVQTDGTIVVGGNFSSVWGLGSNGATRNNLARFLGSGALDDRFAPTLNGSVEALAAMPDGKLVVGGHFTRTLPQGTTSPLSRNHLARLNADGSIDASFELDAGGRPLVSAVQSDGKIIIGGSFTNIGGGTHKYLARLNADGTVDTTFKPDFNDRVFTIAIQPDGKILAGGAFTTVDGQRRERVVRLNSNGTLDTEFFPHFDGQVGVIVLQANGRILVGGTFTSVQPSGADTAESRSNLLRLNANGSLDATFSANPNSSVAAIAVQSDGKIVVGGSFSVFVPGNGNPVSSRNFLARLGEDGLPESGFEPNPNGQVSTIVVQSDGKIVVGGVFTLFRAITATVTTSRNHIARLNADGTLDTAYDPNVNSNLLAMALQSDGKLIIGGTFISIQPNGAPDWTLRKYAARLNTDGTVDSSYDLDINEQSGNRVDSLRVQPDGRVLIGGNFSSLHPVGTPTRIARKAFARLTANGTVDTSFDISAGGAPSGTINAMAVRPDGRVMVAGSFSDLGGSSSTNIARFRPEGTPDSDFSSGLATDGPINALIVRTSGAPATTQLSGFAWLNPNGTMRSGFAAGATQLSGAINSIALQADGRVLLGGAFVNLSNTTGGNLVRFAADGTLDTSFNPNPNGSVDVIAVQPDGRIVIGGSFTTVGGVARNRIARLEASGALDATFDPNANGVVSAIVIEADGRMIVGGAFTQFTPNATTTAMLRNYMARLNADGTVETTYNPTPNFNVNALVLQSDGKAVAGGLFTSAAPNGGVAVTRNGIARFNTDGTLDQNFNPNANGGVNALIALADGQFYVGGTFTTFQPNATGTIYTRNRLARVDSGGTLDLSFDPNANGAVETLALQADGNILVGGAFTSFQPNGGSTTVSRNHLARLNTDGSVDLNFNPDLDGTINVVVAHPDGTALVGGRFDAVAISGSIMIGGDFASVGGVAARNLALLNDNGSVTSTFQPRPDGAVHALLALADGKSIVGGAFTTIAGAARNRIARFNADGTLDTAYTAGAAGPVRALALQADGRVLVGGAGLVRLNANGTPDSSFVASPSGTVTAIAVQADGRIVFATNQSALSRVNADGSADSSFSAAAGGVSAIALQADGRMIVAGAPARLVRLNANGSTDASFNPAPNGAVTAIALQPDGRLMIGGLFANVGGASRAGIARLAATDPATQTLVVAANRGSVVLNRSGTTGEFSAVIFEQSSDQITWVRLGDGIRAPGTANWQLAGLNLPANGLFYIRARGIAPSSSGSSSGIFHVVREFNFANPLASAPGAIAQSPAQAAAPSLAPDPLTGIAPRATIAMVAGEGSVEIFATQTQTGSKPARLANLSTRGLVSADAPLILGFAISGNEPRRVLLRAVGPGLRGFGVSDALAATRLQVYHSSGDELAANEGWGATPELVQASVVTGAFPLAAGSADSAAILTLSPGIYTMQVVDTRGSGGVALAEIYDADSGAGSRLVNVSSRGAAGAGNAALISGFVITGDAAERLLLRAVGPGLAVFGAGGLVRDPVIALYDAEGRALGANDNWVSSVADITVATARAGAFALEVGSKDAAVLATLPGGAYTIQVTGANAGTALLEVYEVR